MGMMIIRHKVRDYGHWRPTFDAHAEMQKANDDFQKMGKDGISDHE